MTTDVSGVQNVFLDEYTSAEAYIAASGLLRSQVAARGRRFRSRVARMDLQGIRVRRGEASSPTTVSGLVGAHHAFIFAMRAAPPRMVNGREVLPEVLAHVRPNELLVAWSPSGMPWPWGSINVPYEMLDQAGPALAGRNVSPSRLDTTLISVPPAPRERLLRVVADIARLATENPRVAEVPAAARALSGVVIEALVACLAQGKSEVDRVASRRRRQVIGRLERLLQERGEEMLTLAQVCAAVGVAERTLHLICHEYLGLGPMQYLRMRRLMRVRDMLLAAEPGGTRVADVAMRYGFWELGRFASAYRGLFGELPSATLRRPPESARDARSSVIPHAAPDFNETTAANQAIAAMAERPIA